MVKTFEEMRGEYQEKKQSKKIKTALIIALIALLFAVFAYSISENISLVGSNATALVAPVDLFFHVNNSMTTTINLSSPLQTITISGNTNGNNLLGYWISDEINVSYIPKGISSAHIRSNKAGGSGTHIVYLFYKLYLTNSTGGNQSLITTSAYTIPLTNNIFSEDIASPNQNEISTNLTDKIRLEIWINQTGSGALPDINFYYDDYTDSRLIFPLHQFEEKDLLALAEINITNNNLQSNITRLDNVNIIQNNSIPFTSQNITTKSLNTVYQNTNLTARMVTFSCYSTAFGLDILSDSNNPPTTLITKYTPTGALYLPFSFIVLPGNYYKLSVWSGNCGTIYWTEWN